MSNSIWKTPTVRPVKDCIVVWQIPAHMSFTLPRTAHKYMEKYNCERWATLDDLIAQVDKAERLRKALDVAIERLNLMARETFQGEPGSINMGFHVRAEAALADINEITALEQKDNK